MVGDHAVRARGDESRNAKRLRRRRYRTRNPGEYALLSTGTHGYGHVFRMRSDEAKAMTNLRAEYWRLPGLIRWTWSRACSMP